MVSCDYYFIQPIVFTNNFVHYISVFLGNLNMEEFIFDFWNFIGGLVAGGAGGAFLTLKLTKNMRTNGDGNTVDQAGAKAGGDIVGRDKKL